MTMTLVVVVGALAMAVQASADMPSFPLSNAAEPGLRIPAVGLGTGGYVFTTGKPIGSYPECWADGKPDPSGHSNPADCGAAVLNATVTWLQLGGRRIDSADSYNNCRTIGEAVRQSGVPRSNIFLVSKIGSGLAMGPSEVDQQVKWMLEAYNTHYLDLVLIHWPTSPAPSNDPQCQMKSATYNATSCRLTTWGQLLTYLKTGTIKAVGVSNYNIEELNEIKDAGMQMPSVNQCPYNQHLYSAQKDLIRYCKEHSILFNSYSPLGIPDWHKYPSEISTTGVLIEEPAIKDIANKYGFSAAQVMLAWQYSQGIISNPRSMSKKHMLENIDPKIFQKELTPDDVKVLQSFKPDSCALQNGRNHWYECCGSATAQPSIPSCGQ